LSKGLVGSHCQKLCEREIRCLTETRRYTEGLKNATTFTKRMSSRNVVFFGEITFTDVMHVGHFNQSGVQVRVKVFK
jgi:hypothetical protein